MGGNVHRRIETLEEQVSPPVPALSVEDEFEGVYQTWWSHACGYTVGLFTDREINILGALYVLEDVPGRTHCFPSGALVAWEENADGTMSLRLDGDVQVEDLPARVSKNVDRMDPAEQPTRHRYLREHPLAYSDHILGAYRISETKKPPRYIPVAHRGGGS